MIIETCPFCERDVPVNLIPNSEIMDGNEVKCSYCKKTWINSSLNKQRIKLSEPKGKK